MTLLWPWMAVLWPLPWLLTYIRPLRGHFRPTEPILYLPDAGAWGETPHNPQPRALPMRLTMFWTLLVLAACRPAVSGDPIRLDTPARSLMLAVDLSPSMAEADMILHGQRTSRMNVVREIVGEFLSQRIGDRVGLIVFGRQAYLHAPLTFDLNTVRTFLEEARIGMAGDRTAIGDAIGLGIKKLRALPASQRVMILLTDGANTAGTVSPLSAARKARDMGIRIYAIGIGQVDRRPNVAPTEILQQIASLTGGQFFNARSTPELELAYSRIGQLEPIRTAAPRLRPVEEQFMWPLIGAWCVLLMPLPHFRRRRHD